MRHARNHKIDQIKHLSAKNKVTVYVFINTLVG